jgi:predicted permease
VLVMSFAIPCALFSTIIGSSRVDLLRHIPAALMITLVFSALYLVSYIWARRRRGLSLSDASVLALTIGFPNSAAIALPLFKGVRLSIVPRRPAIYPRSRPANIGKNILRRTCVTSAP